MTPSIRELGLTRDDEIQVEMGMQRRADHENRESNEPRPTSAGNLVAAVMARMTPLPEQLARRYDSACLSHRNAKRDSARNPGSHVHEEGARSMERQLLRVWTEVCAHRALTAIRQSQNSAAC